MNEGLYAKIITTKGNIILSLEFEKAPVTVANFVGLAEGKIKNNHRKEGIPYYDGIVFHRVIEDFMIQTGDPTGTGSGGPGYSFHDEIHKDLKHDSPGILSMANAGPSTNGSQFFITHVNTEWLDGKHTVFGKVIDDNQVQVVNSIEQGDKINSIEIIRVGEKAQRFDAKKIFEDNMKHIEEKEKSIKEKEIQQIENFVKGYDKNGDIFYKIKKAGQGENIKEKNVVKVHYTGKFLDGKVFDSSLKRNQPFTFKVGNMEVIEGWDKVVRLFNKGTLLDIVLPSWLAYGKYGAGGVIPPFTPLAFEIEILDVN